jgi:8-oxo-dGTP diphosphatase
MPRFPRIAVRAIITNQEGHVLILKRARTRYANGCWNLPGGKLEYNETAEAALKAEIREETGLEITRFAFYDYLDNLPEFPGGPHYITLIFTCEATGEIKLCNESSAYRWIGKEDLEEVEMAFGNGGVIGGSLNTSGGTFLNSSGSGRPRRV